jgi:rhamnose utilization protein RhaD (predicted bifunctional aldolase and dehydrogenase)
MLQKSVFSPSMETPMHAFLDKKCIVHTHPSAILALSNRKDGQKTVAEALGDEAGFVPYASLGFNLGRAVAAEMTVKNDPPAIVLAQHGLVVWGETPREAYEKTIQYVTRAEEYLKEKTVPIFPARGKTSLHTAYRLFNQCLPMLKELLSRKAETTGDAAGQEVVLSHLATEKLLELLDYPRAEEIFCSAPLNPDHLLRIKIRPVYLENPPYDDPEDLRRLVARGIKSYKDDYARYIERHAGQLRGLTLSAEEFLPRALLFPGMGVVTAAKDAATADICRDIIRQAMHVKSVIHETGGTYAGLLEDDAFEMELRVWKKAAAVSPKI